MKREELRRLDRLERELYAFGGQVDRLERSTRAIAQAARSVYSIPSEAPEPPVVTPCCVGAIPATMYVHVSLSGAGGPYKAPVPVAWDPANSWWSGEAAFTHQAYLSAISGACQGTEQPGQTLWWRWQVRCNAGEWERRSSQKTCGIPPGLTRFLLNSQGDYNVTSPWVDGATPDCAGPVIADWGGVVLFSTSPTP